MSFGLRRSAVKFTFVAAIAAGLLSTPASAESPVSGLLGNWTGGGQATLENGKTEKLTCRAYYTSQDGGSGMGVALRCASAGYKIEFRSAIHVNGSRVTGTWEERTFNLAGAVSGSASASALSLAFSGGVSGSMSVNYTGSTQRVSITTASGGLSRVSLNLSRG